MNSIIYRRVARVARLCNETGARYDALITTIVTSEVNGFAVFEHDADHDESVFKDYYFNREDAIEAGVTKFHLAQRNSWNQSCHGWTKERTLKHEKAGRWMVRTDKKDLPENHGVIE